MSLIRIRHVDRFVDRHGKLRHYYRPPGGKRIALPGKPGSPEFMAAYQAAVSGVAPKAPPKARGAAGTFDRLVQDYYASPDYLRLANSTKTSYRHVIDRLLRDEKIGHRLVAEMTREHVKRIVAKRVATPGAANDVLKKLKILLHFAIDSGIRNDDPTIRVKGFAEGEFHTWTDEEIAQFEASWPVGTREHTAFALLLFTGQRAADVSRMSWDDVEGGAIRVVQGKTGAKLLIPLHAQLAEAIARWPKTHACILTTSFGKPFSTKGISNYMASAIGDAKLPDQCVTHGLRKAAARRLAEAGCSANEIASITGHATLQEVARYTKAAEQKRLAAAAIDRLTLRRGKT